MIRFQLDFNLQLLEKTISSTIGVDALLFSKLDIMFDIWQRNTKDMLYRVPIPAVVGDAIAPSVNIGEMKNIGFDFQVGYEGITLTIGSSSIFPITVTN